MGDEAIKNALEEGDVIDCSIGSGMDGFMPITGKIIKKDNVLLIKVEKWLDEENKCNNDIFDLKFAADIKRR